MEVALTLSNDDNEHFLTIINDEITNDDNFSLESIRVGVLRAINQYFLISLSKYEIPPLVIATHINVDAERNNFYSSRPYYRIFDGKDINNSPLNFKNSLCGASCNINEFFDNLGI